MKIFLFYFEIAIKLQGRHKIIGSLGLAETDLFLGLSKLLSCILNFRGFCFSLYQRYAFMPFYISDFK